MQFGGVRSDQQIAGAGGAARDDDLVGAGPFHDGGEAFARVAVTEDA